MRWLFLIVLSLNLAYFAWQTNKPTTDLYANVQVLKDVQPIVLLSELKQQKQADVQTIAQSEVGRESIQQEDKAENSLDEKTEVDKISAKQPQVAEKTPAPENTGPAKNKDITVADVKQSDLTEVSQLKIPQSKSCFTLGPFRDLDKLSRLTREIKSYVVKADFRGREEKQQSLYWVYVKPEKNRKKAIETGERLKANKIKDFFIIREGEKNNGISLGRFRNKNGAYGLAKKAKKLGFNVIVEPVFEIYTIYWLDYQLANGVNIPEAIIEKYIQSNKKDKISRLSRDCGS